MRTIFAESAKELRKTRSLVGMAMLLALAVVLGFVSVQVTESLRVGGLIYGLVLYKKPVTLPRIILCNTLIAVFVNMLLNTYWLTLLYGNSFLAIWPARIVSNLITLPINIILYYLVATLLEKAGILREYTR